MRRWKRILNDICRLLKGDSTEKPSFNAEAQRRKEDQIAGKDSNASIFKNIEASFNILCAFASLR
jgi:hypothetical protein